MGSYLNVGFLKKTKMDRSCFAINLFKYPFLYTLCVTFSFKNRWDTLIMCLYFCILCVLGWFYEQTGSYNISFLVVSGVYLVAGIIFAVEMACTDTKPAKIWSGHFLHNAQNPVRLPSQNQCTCSLVVRCKQINNSTKCTHVFRLCTAITCVCLTSWGLLPF